MMNYTISLSTVENLALSYAVFNQTDWIENAVHARCQSAIDEIAALVVQKCLDTGTPIPASKELMVELAFSNNWVQTAAQRQAAIEAEAAAAHAAAIGQNETNTNV